jgi:hypothetical protein
MEMKNLIKILGIAGGCLVIKSLPNYVIVNFSLISQVFTKKKPTIRHHRAWSKINKYLVNFEERRVVVELPF